ncbi:hypothetical protein EJ08DRAFT_654295 [Tothia fuscella]|uniref:Uncharacterized protein n=1 Tax=Tothia fuscella TaxID=1048955 RepID=A0A9P4NF19_9PEZI|nr:hypothetical protein EJ08DRAFT_654295 [Tothia fuscella]
MVSGMLLVLSSSMVNMQCPIYAHLPSTSNVHLLETRGAYCAGKFEPRSKESCPPRYKGSKNDPTSVNMGAVT